MIAIPVYVREEKNYELLKACVESVPKGKSLKLFINAWEYDKDIETIYKNGGMLMHKNSVAGAWNKAIKYTHENLEGVCIIANQDIEFPDINELENIALEKGICAARTKEGEPDFALFAVSISWLWDTFNTLEPFDEGFEGAYFEDNDFKYQCKLKGIEIPTIDLDFKHFGSSVVTLDLEAQKENEKRFRKNHIRYINKWGGIRNFETFKTPFNK